MAAINIILILLLTLSLSTTIAAAPPPPSTALISTVLSTLGFPTLSSAAITANLSTNLPTTIFAPTESSLLTCKSCSIPILLQEHALPGLYPLNFIRNLAFGTKIESIAGNRCLTVTNSPSPSHTAAIKVFINGVQIDKPDLFNNGVLVIHSIKGFVSHLSPISCSIESMSTLAPPQAPPVAAFANVRLMLTDAITKLRTSGYSVVALAMRLRYSEISDLRSMTLFAMDDESIFVSGAGGRYVAELGFHVVPNRILMAAELEALPRGANFSTLDRRRSLEVTTAGGGGMLRPMRINYVKMKRFDLVSNGRIVVHGVARPFRHVEDRADVVGLVDRENERSRLEAEDHQKL